MQARSNHSSGHTGSSHRARLIADVERFRALRQITSHIAYQDTITALIQNQESTLAELEGPALPNARFNQATRTSLTPGPRTSLTPGR